MQIEKENLDSAYDKVLKEYIKQHPSQNHVEFCISPFGSKCKKNAWNVHKRATMYLK